MKAVPDCPACGSSTANILAVLDAERRARFEDYSERKYGGLITKWIKDVLPVVTGCPNCGHCWYRNQPDSEQLRHMYAAGRTITYGVQSSSEATLHMREEMRRLRKMVGNNAEPVTLLDFGSGFGRWSRAAVLEGFTVTAYEPSFERGSGSDTRFKLVHSIEEIENHKFDAIQLEQVLEHVPDPLATLKQLRDLCNSHTVIRMAVPNLLRDQDGPNVWSTWPFDGQRPHFLAPFEHLHGFTPKSLDYLLKRAGYKNIRLTSEATSAGANLLRQLIGRFYPTLNSTLRYIQAVN